MCPSPSNTTSPLLSGLVHAVTTAYNTHRDPKAQAAAIAAALQPFLGNPRLLTPAQQEEDPERYRQHLLHVDSRGVFSIVALVWLPGQSTVIHDHIAWAAIGVHQGVEREESFVLVEAPAGSFLVPGESSTLGAGEVASLTPPGDIHRVANAGAGKAVSIHVYGADLSQLGTSIRRRYELPIRLSA